MLERLVRHTCSRVRKSSVLPAKNDSEVGGKVLLGAVDVSDVHNPDSNGDLSWPAPAGGRSIKARVSALRATWLEIANKTKNRRRIRFMRCYREAARFRLRIRSTSRIASGLHCALCLEFTISSDSAPSRCELQYGTIPSELFGVSPLPRSPMIE